MNFRVPSLLLSLCLTIHASQGAEDGRQEEKRPGFFSRVTKSLNPFASKEGGKDAKEVNWQKLQMNLELEPQPLKLPETRLLKVRLQLTNKSKRFVQLEFPTSQRVEVLVRNKAGKMVEQWSEDQSFSNEPSMVVINAGERIEYAVQVATRDMTPGEEFTIEAFFPNYDKLKIQRTIVPEK